jgi:hypothetical protein
MLHRLMGSYHNTRQNTIEYLTLVVNWVRLRRILGSHVETWPFDPLHIRAITFAIKMGNKVE